MAGYNVWLFDVAHPLYTGSKDENVCLLGLGEDGRLYELNDHFDDYFYVVEESGVSSLLSNISSEYNGIKISRVRRRLFGREVDLLKISGGAEELKRAREVLRRRVGDEYLYEDDVRDTIKYLIDNDITPCSWYSFEGSKVADKNGLSIYRIESLSRVEGGPPLPPIKAISVDMVVISDFGEPDFHRDPVNYLAVYDGDEYHEFMVSGRDDTDIIRGLNEIVKRLDPNVIVSFGGNSFVWPYLVGRGRQLGIKIGLGVLGHEIHQSLYGHFSFFGRINIDLKEYVDDNPIFELKTLEELAEYAGLRIPSTSIDPFSYALFWNDRRQVLIDYVKWRVMAIYKLFWELMEQIFSLSSVTGIPPDYVLTASSGRQAEQYIMRMSRKRGELIPKVLGRRMRSYPGGLVLSPKKGVHSNVAVIDFKSMYPSIIMKYNVSPDTIVKESGGDVDFYEELGIGVRRDIKGILPEIVETLVRERDLVRKMMKEYPRDSPMYKLLDSKQRILKILANTMYGYMGWIAARWYSFEGASLVTYLGRRTIRESIEKARELGLNIIYGDTDSVFIEYDEDRVNSLLRWISEYLGMEAKIDKVYRKVLFTEAKKRYAGLTVDGRIDIVGLEYVRRDWCELARETQYRFVKLVLEGASKNRLLDEFRSIVNEIRSGKVALDKFVIWEQITRDLSEYKANAPHIAVARALSRRGWRIRKGMFIGYVVVKGDGPLYKRSVHYLEADMNKIDREYYIRNQILPVVARVVEPIGINEKTLLSIVEVAGTGLDRFFG